MEQLSHTQSATDLVGDINANLHEMSSQVEVAVTDSAESLVGNLNTAFANVDGKVALSKDTDAETFVGNLNTNFEAAADAGGGGSEPDTPTNPDIPSYNSDIFGNEMTDTLNKVNALHEDALLTYLVSTDHHNEIDGWAGARPKNYCHGVTPTMVSNQKKFVEMCGTGTYSGINVDGVLLMGDFTDGMKTDDAYIEAYPARTMNLFDSIGKPLIIAVGNHDNNIDSNSGSRQLYDDELYNLFIEDRVGEDNAQHEYVYYKDIYGDDSPNYYIDYDDKKLRVIVLNCNGGLSNSGSAWLFKTETVNFLTAMFGKTAALGDLTEGSAGYGYGMPQDYKAIVVCHINPISVKLRGDDNNGRKKFTQIINAFKSRILLLINGHRHLDNVYMNSSKNGDNTLYTDSGVEIIASHVGCNKHNGSSNTSGSFNQYFGAFYSHRGDDYTNDLWDVFVLDKTMTRADFIRFGAGFDRHIHLGIVDCQRSGVVLTADYLSGKTVTWGIHPSPMTKDNTDEYVDASVTLASVSDGAVSLSQDAPKGDIYIIVYCEYSENNEIKAREFWGLHFPPVQQS